MTSDPAGRSAAIPAEPEKISGRIPSLPERLRAMPDRNLCARLAQVRFHFAYAVTPIQRRRVMDEIDALVTEQQRRGIACSP